MKLKRVSFLIIAITLVFWAINFWDSKESPEIIFPQHRVITETLLERAVVKATHQYNLFAKVSAPVAHIEVDEGDFVSKNQTLLRLDTLEHQYLLDQNLLQKKQKQIQVTFLKNSLDQYKTLARKQLVAEESFQEVKQKYQIEKLKLDALIKKNTYLEKQQKFFDLQSESAAQVSEIYVKKGQQIKQGQLLMKLEDSQKMHLELFVSEYNASKIRLGQTVNVLSISGESLNISGTISKILPKHNRDSFYIKVWVDLDQKLQALQIGSRVDAEIVVNQKQDCLSVPITALVREKEKSFVVIAANQKKRPVQLGLQNHQHVEILSGLSPKEGVFSEASY